MTAAGTVGVAPRPTVAARIAIAGIRAYQYAFAWRAPSCRFAPTCSQYTLLAVRRHGAWRGLLLGIRRIGRCHPWNPGGYDPVPAAEDTNVRSLSGAGSAGAKGRNS